MSYYERESETLWKSKITVCDWIWTQKKTLPAHVSVSHSTVHRLCSLSMTDKGWKVSKTAFTLQKSKPWFSSVPDPDHLFWNFGSLVRIIVQGVFRKLDSDQTEKSIPNQVGVKAPHLHTLPPNKSIPASIMTLIRTSPLSWAVGFNTLTHNVQKINRPLDVLLLTGTFLSSRFKNTGVNWQSSHEHTQILSQGKTCNVKVCVCVCRRT